MIYPHPNLSSFRLRLLCACGMLFSPTYGVQECSTLCPSPFSTTTLIVDKQQGAADLRCSCIKWQPCSSSSSSSTSSSSSSVSSSTHVTSPRSHGVRAVP
ncbi:unnamed protein product [Prorocentrum cordatum]|uniref:Secreted protein n=1 Tax=Prorocentrum cordatum TaxID=2364126 RepID=A0ABN9XAW3_9DINO|nr:unnamed protein product [Polarella glacialis]